MVSFLVNLVDVDVSLGRTLLYLGKTSTSSKVKPEIEIFELFTDIANKMVLLFAAQRYFMTSLNHYFF